MNSASTDPLKPQNINVAYYATASAGRAPRSCGPRRGQDCDTILIYRLEPPLPCPSEYIHGHMYQSIQPCNLLYLYIFSILFYNIYYTTSPPLSLSLSSFSLSLSLSLGLLKPRIRSLSDGWIEAGTPSAERPSLWKGGAGGSFWGQVASF